MKKLFILLCFTLNFFVLFGQNYTIKNVEYNIDGRTRERNVRRNFPIDYDKEFNSENELLQYLNKIKTDLNNSRIFENINIQYIFLQEEDNYIPVELTIDLKESFSFLAIPYFKYDSNSGSTFKIKAKDYNFLGSLNEMNLDLNYQIINNEETNEKGSKFSINFDYDHPFSIGKTTLTWNNDYSFYYTLGTKEPEWDIKTGFLLDIPIKNLSLNFNFNQGFFNDFDYLMYNDKTYFQEEVKISLPIVLNDSLKYGKINLTPYIHFIYNWDKNGIDINNSDLSSPLISIGQEFSVGKVNWINNFRKGLKFSMDNKLSYNTTRKEFIPYINFDLYFHYCFENSSSWLLSRLGINANLYGFIYIPLEKNKFYYGEKYGDNLRGIRDEQFFNSDLIDFGNTKALSSYTAITLSLDFPFKLFSTNFTKRFTKYFNFEMQIAPFIDISLGYNRYTKRYFHPRDGFYTAGMELLVYPQKWSSFTVRGSLGIDMGRFLNIVDNSWRSKVSPYEFSFGIGLHY